MIKRASTALKMTNGANSYLLERSMLAVTTTLLSPDPTATLDPRFMTLPLTLMCSFKYCSYKTVAYVQVHDTRLTRVTREVALYLEF